jgi:hypothetical protein
MPTKPAFGPRSRLQCRRHAAEAFADSLELRVREAPAEVHGSCLQEAFGRRYATAEVESAAAVDHCVPRGRSARGRLPERRWCGVCSKIASCDLALGSAHASVIEYMNRLATFVA